jgi:PEGA domain
MPPSATKTKPRSTGKFIMLLAALLSVVGIGGAALLFMPRTGMLKVYVSGPEGRDVGPVDIYVDNEKVCSSSPCSVQDLPPGTHDVSAKADGYAPAATKGVEITEGGQSKFEIELFEAGTGIKVAGQPGITLHVDGKEVGPLPQTLATLRPGEHELRFVGSDRQAPLTRTVTVLPYKIEDLGEIKLEVIKGAATFEFVTTGIAARLVPADGEARKIDEEMLEDRRFSTDIDTSKQWKLEACLAGYEFLEIPISFADGQAEKTFKVELVENEAMDRKHLKSWCPSAAAASASPGSPAAAARPLPDTTNSAGSAGGTLNINSIPPSAAVLLDGKPLGRTPMSGVKVPAGTHSVVFIHPEKGRKATSVTVGAGQSRGVGVRF